jgi:hypothetical protein
MADSGDSDGDDLAYPAPRLAINVRSTPLEAHKTLAEHVRALY